MTAIVEYSKTEAALADLAGRFKGVVYDVTTGGGMADAKKARGELRDYRVSLEATRVEIKAPALERCRLIDAEAKRITKALTDLEDPIDAQIKREDQRKEAERNAAIRVEQERLAAEEKARKEAEEAKLAAERKAIEEERAKLEEERREREAHDRAARLKLEEDQRESRQQIEAQERAARLAREEAYRQAREAREAEERAWRKAQEQEDARMKAARDRIEAERRAGEEEQRKVREAEEELRREDLRQKQELQDGYGLLESFVKRFGRRKEFAPAVTAIRTFLSSKVRA